jgi:hypothetical protein
MSSEFVLSITTKDIPKQKNPIHLVMWEGSDTLGQNTQELLDRIAQLEKALAKLLEEKSSSLFFPQALHPTPRGIEVKSRSNSFTNELDTMNVFNTISRATSGSQMPDLNLNEVPVFKEEEAEADEMSDIEMDEADEADAVDADAVDASIREEADAVEPDASIEEEADELQEFTWKGKIYYKDSDSLVYELDADGDLNETPIGVWKDETQKVVKYKTV